MKSIIRLGGTLHTFRSLYLMSPQREALNVNSTPTETMGSQHQKLSPKSLFPTVPVCHFAPNWRTAWQRRMNRFLSSLSVRSPTLLLHRSSHTLPLPLLCADFVQTLITGQQTKYGHPFLSCKELMFSSNLCSSLCHYRAKDDKPSLLDITLGYFFSFSASLDNILFLLQQRTFVQAVLWYLSLQLEVIYLLN